MTRVVRGIYDTVELNTGFFLPDNQIDYICGWLDDYANRLEKDWVDAGSQGEPKRQAFAKVRSFKAAVERGRNGENSQGKEKQKNGSETNDQEHAA